MGADGHVQFIEKDAVPLKYADLDPSKIGWHQRELFGHTILWRYWDTERDNDVWESPAAYFTEFNAAKHRSREDRPPSKYYSGEYRRADLDYIAKCEADAGHEQKMQEGELYDEFDMFLSGNAEDWKVWT